VIKTTMDRTDFIEAENHYLRTALRAKDADYRALLEVVRWERELDEALTWLVQTGRYPKDTEGREVLFAERECARAAVNALIGVK
jgi:hypothetical protein